MGAHNKLGKKGEVLAADFLIKNGYLVERNENKKFEILTPIFDRKTR